jgi:hypothetical protein
MQTHSGQVVLSTLREAKKGEQGEDRVSDILSIMQRRERERVRVEETSRRRKLCDGYIN